MAITIDDFSKIWASTSPLTPYEFSEDNYKSGWNFVGGTPPSRQMWDFLQKNNDEKMQYLANNYLPLSGGTMTGDIGANKTAFTIQNTYANNAGSVLVRASQNNFKSAMLSLNGTDTANTKGGFVLAATNGSQYYNLVGRQDGTLTWDGKAIIVGNKYTQTFTNVSCNANTAVVAGTLTYDPTYYSVKMDGTGYADFSAIVNTSNKNVYIRNNSSTNRTGLTVTVNYIVL